MCAAARVQVAVTVALAPLGVLWFGQVPFAGALANAVAIPWVGTLVTPLVLAGVALPAPLDAPALHLAQRLIALLFDGFAWAGFDERVLFDLPQPAWPAFAAAMMGAA
ncbi:MAG: hypothetical protein GAK40_00484 [Burkholderia plantarii]|nr:MAG: hypothetical protein GAK40_00484 [Burkholderia plantarii]